MAVVEVQARANLWHLTVGQVDTVDTDDPEIAACLERGLLVVRDATTGEFPDPVPLRAAPGGCGCGH